MKLSVVRGRGAPPRGRTAGALRCWRGLGTRADPPPVVRLWTLNYFNIVNAALDPNIGMRVNISCRSHPPGPHRSCCTTPDILQFGSSSRCNRGQQLAESRVQSMTTKAINRPPARRLRPLLRWAGSKRQLLAPLRDTLPSPGYVYVEPFCGSAALFFQTLPQKAVLADINLDLINFYQSCQSAPTQLFEISKRLRRTQSTYYYIRSAINRTPFDTQRAAYFYYLNRNCFNGLYRTNKKGEFNVPFSRSRTGRMLSKQDFIAAASLLRGAKLSTADFEVTIEREKGPNAFFFLDPPYAIARRQPFAEYGEVSFSTKDLARLMGCLEAIDDSGGRFALTYDSRLGHLFALRKPWRQRKLTVRRNISGFAGARRNAIEILTTNFSDAPNNA
jgi:DNA adenine methylase